MYKVSLTAWGNSMGVRIPKEVIKQANLYQGETLNINVDNNGAIMLTPANDPQYGWTEAFNKIAEEQEQELLLDINNQFDEDEWTW